MNIIVMNPQPPESEAAEPPALTTINTGDMDPQATHNESKGMAQSTDMSKTTSDMNEQSEPAKPESTECRLLDLAAELRNEIYRLVLVEDRPYPVTYSGIDEPGLLKTCKQIRNKTMPIFYGENTLHVKMTHYNSDILVNWCDQKQRPLWRKLKLEIKETMPGRQTRNWCNLRTWLQRSHAGDLWSVEPESEHLRARNCANIEDHLVATMFEAVIVARGLPWDTVASLVDSQQRALIALNSGWK